jgi:hypothetical protein
MKTRMFDSILLITGPILCVGLFLFGNNSMAQSNSTLPTSNAQTNSAPTNSDESGSTQAASSSTTGYIDNH